MRSASNVGLRLEDEGWERLIGSKRGSRDLREGEGSRMVRLRVMAWRVERVCGACLEVRCFGDVDDGGLKDWDGVATFPLSLWVLGSSVLMVRFRFPGRGGGAKASWAFASAPKLMSFREVDGVSFSRGPGDCTV